MGAEPSDRERADPSSGVEEAEGRGGAHHRVRRCPAAHGPRPGFRSGRKGINDGVAQIVAERGEDTVRADLRAAFTQIATRFGGLQRLHTNPLPSESGDLVRTLRAETLLASNAAWRALCVALHEAKKAGVDPEKAIDRVKNDASIEWTRNADFFKGTILEVDLDTDQPTGKVLSSRESIDAAAEKLAAVMMKSSASARDRGALR